MRHILFWLAVLMVAGGLLLPGSVLAGSVDDGAKKADQGIHSAGQKVDSSTKSMRDATDAGGKKAEARKMLQQKKGGCHWGALFDTWIHAWKSIGFVWSWQESLAAPCFVLSSQGTQESKH